MDDSQPTTAQVVHAEGEQQARVLVDVVDTPHPGDWTGHVPGTPARAFLNGNSPCPQTLVQQAAHEPHTWTRGVRERHCTGQTSTEILNEIVAEGATTPDPVFEQQVAALVAAGFTMADLAAALQRGATLATYLTDTGTPEIAELLRNAIALKPRCASCGRRPAGYRNFAAQPFCRPCADDQPTPADAASTLLAASEAQGWAQRPTPTATPADAISILRSHADWLDPAGADVPPVDSLTAATLRMAAQFLEDVAPLPRRRRLHPGLVGEMIDAAHALQRAAAGPVDIRFVPVPGHGHDAELSTPIPDDACEVLEVDGQPVRIHGQGDLSGEAQAAVESLVRIGREQLEAEEEQAGADGP